MSGSGHPHGQYSRNANAGDAFGRSAGCHLSLVTCAEAWDATVGIHAPQEKHDWKETAVGIA